MTVSSTHHEVLIVGGGSAGISVAARLRRSGVADVAVIEPSDRHFYQPLWTLVGGGRADAELSVRPEESVMPKGVTWIRQRACGVAPDVRRVMLADGRQMSYDFLVMAPGLRLDPEAVPGLAEALGHDGVSTNYRFDLAPRTWQFIRETRGGTAVFTMPPGPIKCGGAPQKIAYLAADWWRRQGVLDKMRLILVLPTAAMFTQPQWGEVLKGVAAGYGIEGRHDTQLVEVDGPARRVVLLDTKSGTKEDIGFEVLHATPPQGAPHWVRAGPLADPDSAFGYVQVDRYTLQSPRWPTVFALGDVANLPTSKTGAAIRKQAPVLVANLLAARRGDPLPARYDGYTSCPLVTSRNRMLLAEFDYELRPRPSFPLIDTMRPRSDMWLLKRYGLPTLYWHGMLRGRI
ncbi:NAD(P)/FAD-dependent oxidoreductase [Dactylosporangium aurantiacum]|uniref:NAD(P)/FAD-dependent oxidoreductase n=1 Tax=Dactylosporangium aurantiacum TaxID=35754 RepID=A0A9Q9IAX9_9ACTN|nr:FAD/NAD(P)-binding oxidoreductase [Dactylosporangium aurantiacum]MDG6110425.1 FAD/NAD(P)-binding oxidoreductase [Dactylosporangium aurantiacum]UWZ51050.1 NAD(P)/FAD-dependent oxidoreductase [Dactylosporangium aurantiacum]